MRVIEVLTGEEFLAEIVFAELADLKRDNFYFEWEKEINQRVVKLQLKTTKEILGLMSLEVFSKESFVKIRLLAVSEVNRGRNKKFDRIAGHLITYAAQLAAEDCSGVAKEAGLRKVKVFVKGPGNGRESAIRSLHNAGIEITEIIDVTPIPHNGCRPPKRRRV